MRVGKKPTVVEAKKTRSCVVRLEKFRQPITKFIKIGKAISYTPTQLQEEKKLRGPLKKRPISEMAASAGGKLKIKEKETAKGYQKSRKDLAAGYETPPTIAAGRSRRAIKPNPKYASEDMVTPKLIKSVTALGGMSTSQKKVLTNEKERKFSGSSSEDFYNKESSDEVEDYGELDETDDNTFIMEEKDSDSDFLEDVAEMPQQLKKKRGRPRKDQKQSADNVRPDKSSSVFTPKTTTVRAVPSQLQQLRKSIASSVNISRLSDTSSTFKRKLEADPQEESSADVTRKRLFLNSAIKYKMAGKDIKDLIVRKSLPIQTLNGNKVSVQSSERNFSSLQDKRKTETEKIVAKNTATPNLVKLKPNPILANKSLNVKFNSITKTRIESISTLKTVKPDGKEEKITTGMSPSSTVDDFETMPTFTIVNINDIINKKGDVLISKTNKAKKADSPKLNKEEDKISIQTDIKVNKRKSGYTAVLLEKSESDRLKQNAQQRSPLPSRKTSQTILNHALVNKIGGNSPNQRPGMVAAKTVGVCDKPAPRILNSVVAKKTQPVKPMIANFEDSAEESVPLSMDDDEDNENKKQQLSVDKRKFNSALSPTKKAAPATKENTLAAINRVPPTKTIQRKLTPEKVIISRQGNKIIKKITCFETWYVINMEENCPPKNMRNILDLPLIKLANVASSIKLPSRAWTSKVTLYELSPSTISKASFVTYTGDLKEHNISEHDRANYQPSCVMFRRAVDDRFKSRLPYDKAVIFKNKSFFTNIQGKNVKLIGAPTAITSTAEVEILLLIVDSLNLQHCLVEPSTTIQ